MQFRPAQASDLDRVADIDGTIESLEYLHLERTGHGLSMGWKLEPRALRTKLIESNAMNDDHRFALRQVVEGMDDGVALVVEREENPIAVAVAMLMPERGTLHLVDLRVDFDYRRQGMATVLMYQILQGARDRELRAVSAETRTNNLPASRMLQKLSFEIAGIDTHRHSNHDMVKESATILWYAALD